MHHFLLSPSQICCTTEMEIIGEDGSIFNVKGEDFKAEFGRGSGFKTKDRTASRRHVLFQLNQTEPRVSFQVVGKNPLWLQSERKLRIFRKLEKGQMETGDCFCISSQNPVWFNLKEIESENWGSVEISQIDPVKEFGFLVMGHEFDGYPKGRIRNPENWDWFLEETRGKDDDSDGERKGKKGGRRKRKKDEDEDEEWSDDMGIAVVRKVDGSKYRTRSKDKGKALKGKERKTGSSKMVIEEEEDDDDDEDDDTLGGFIVDDVDEDEEKGGENEDEDEEELMEDEEDEELDD